MKKIEEEFIKELDSLGNRKSFADIKDAIDLERFRKKKKSPAPMLHKIMGAVAVSLLLTAIIVPGAIYFSPSGGAPPKVDGPTAGNPPPTVDEPIVSDDPPTYDASLEKGNIFNGKNITIDFLQEKDCLFYENLVFAEDNKNHVFVTNEDEVAEHYMFDKVEFNKDNFADLYNKNIIDAVAYIGIPSFEGISSELSLDYSCVDGYIRRLKLSENDDKLFINEVEVLNKEDSSTWFDAEKTDLPSLETCQKIQVGMSLDEVVRLIGKPQRDVGFGATWFQFDINNGSILNLWFDLDVEKENDFHKNHPESAIYGTHFLYVVRIEYDFFPLPVIDRRRDYSPFNL